MKQPTEPTPISSPYMTLKETAEFFRVSETSVRRSRGVFAKLRRTTLNKRTLIYRESVEALAAELNRNAYVVAEHGLVNRHSNRS
jgi:hypothetical protein